MKWICLFFFFVNVVLTYSQVGEVQHMEKDNEIMMPNPRFQKLNIDPFNSYIFSQAYKKNDFALQPLPLLNHHPGLFCKLEYKMEVKSKLAPRFRLGSLNYTDWMDGKKGFEERYMR